LLQNIKWNKKRMNHIISCHLFFQCWPQISEELINRMDWWWLFCLKPQYHTVLTKNIVVIPLVTLLQMVTEHKKLLMSCDYMGRHRLMEKKVSLKIIKLLFLSTYNLTIYWNFYIFKNIIINNIIKIKNKLK